MGTALMKTAAFLILLVAMSGCKVDQDKKDAAEEDPLKVITLSSLLEEMVDRDQMANFPEQRFKLKQQSSYNRASKTPEDTEGWFNNIDRFEYVRIDTINGAPEWVLMDHVGPGAMSRIWMPDRLSPTAVLEGKEHDGNGIIRVYLDDNPLPVLEGSPYDLFDGTELAGYPFGHKSLSSAVSFLPFPWAERCKITLSREPFFFIFTYRAYEEGALVKTLTKNDLDAASDILVSTGEQLVNPVNADGNEKILNQVISAEQEVSISLEPGAKAIKTLAVRFMDYSNSQVTRSVILKMKFDGQETVWTPIGDFFGSGVGLHPFEGWYRSVESDGTMTCRWVMPYKESAEITIVNLMDEPIETELIVTTDDWEWKENSMYFHANWRLETDINTRPHSDWNYITIDGKGVYVGDALTVWNPVKRWWGEGDEKIWVDNEAFPSMFGTGTEDYYAYSWGGKNRAFYEHPFHAQVRVNQFDKNYGQKVPVEGDTKGYSTETRTRALDGIAFDERLQLDMEIWAWTDCKMDYAVGTYWYALPGTTSNLKPMVEEAKLSIKNITQTE